MVRAQWRGMIRIAALCILAAACGGSSVEPLDTVDDGLTVAASIGPQSLTHGTLTASRPQLAYAFNGKAGDTIAPDLWPTGKSALTAGQSGFQVKWIVMQGCWRHGLNQKLSAAMARISVIIKCGVT